MKIPNPAKIFLGLRERRSQKIENVALFKERVSFLFNPKNKQEQKVLTDALKKEGITAPILAGISEAIALNVNVYIGKELRVMRGYHASTINLVKGTTFFSKIVVVVRDLCGFTDISDISAEEAVRIIIDDGIFQSSA